MKSKAEQIYEAIGEGFGFNGSKEQCIEVIKNILKANKPPTRESKKIKELKSKIESLEFDLEQTRNAGSFPSGYNLGYK